MSKSSRTSKKNTSKLQDDEIKYLAKLIPQLTSSKFEIGKNNIIDLQDLDMTFGYTKTLKNTIQFSQLSLAHLYAIPITNYKKVGMDKHEFEIMNEFNKDFQNVKRYAELYCIQNLVTMYYANSIINDLIEDVPEITLEQLKQYVSNADINTFVKSINQSGGAIYTDILFKFIILIALLKEVTSKFNIDDFAIANNFEFQGNEYKQSINNVLVKYDAKVQANKNVIMKYGEFYGLIPKTENAAVAKMGKFIEEFNKKAGEFELNINEQCIELANNMYDKDIFLDFNNFDELIIHDKMVQNKKKYNDYIKNRNYMGWAYDAIHGHNQDIGDLENMKMEIGKVNFYETKKDELERKQLAFYHKKDNELICNHGYHMKLILQVDDNNGYNINMEGSQYDYNEIEKRIKLNEANLAKKINSLNEEIKKIQDTNEKEKQEKLILELESMRQKYEVLKDITSRIKNIITRPIFDERFDLQQNVENADTKLQKMNKLVEYMKDYYPVQKIEAEKQKKILEEQRKYMELEKENIENQLKNLEKNKEIAEKKRKAEKKEKEEEIKEAQHEGDIKQMENEIVKEQWRQYFNDNINLGISIFTNAIGSVGGTLITDILNMLLNIIPGGRWIGTGLLYMIALFAISSVYTVIVGNVKFIMICLSLPGKAIWVMYKVIEYPSGKMLEFVKTFVHLQKELPAQSPEPPASQSKDLLPPPPPTNPEISEVANILQSLKFAPNDLEQRPSTRRKRIGGNRTRKYKKTITKKKR